MADRIKGIMATFMVALPANRVFLIEEWQSSESAHPLLYYLEPHLVAWQAAPHPALDLSRTKYVKTKDCSGGPKVCQYQKSMNHTVGLRCTAKYFAKRSIYARLPCLEEAHIEIPKKIELFHDVFHTVFRFSNRVRAEADRLRGERAVLPATAADKEGESSTRLRSLLKKEDNQENQQDERVLNPAWYVGVHIRTGQGATWNDPLRHNTKEDWQKFAKCAAVVTQHMAAQCPQVPSPMSYVASDNDDAKEYMRQQNPSGTHLAHIPIYHMDRSTTSMFKNVTAAYDATIGEFKVLMDSTCIIMSNSGFSNLARDLSRMQPRCYLTNAECAEPDDDVLQAMVKERVSRLSCPAA